MTALDKTLQIAGIGLVGVFLFMILFYLIILLIDKFFPYKKEINVEGSSNDKEEK